MKTIMRLHRFQRWLAFHTETGETEYLSVTEAKDLKKALNAFIKDSKNTFVNSEFGTVEIKQSKDNK